MVYGRYVNAVCSVCGNSWAAAYKDLVMSGFDFNTNKCKECRKKEAFEKHDKTKKEGSK